MKKRNSERAVAVVLLMSLILVVSYEIWMDQLAVLAYIAMVIASPLLVLFISDRTKGPLAA